MNDEDEWEADCNISEEQFTQVFRTIKIIYEE
jgi:hypothetical protein